MSVSQAQRFEMQLGLLAVLGDEVGNTLMEHLPPSGWSDVARTHDIERLNIRFEAIDARFEAIDARFEAVDARFDGLGKRMDRMEEDLRGVRNSMRALTASVVAVSAAIIVLLIQLNQNISRL